MKRFFLFSALLLAFPLFLTGTERYLDVRNLTTLDVLLFELQPTSNLTISAFDGDVTIRAGQRSWTQEMDQPAFAISVHNGQIQVRHPEFRGTVSELIFETDDSSMIRMNHPEAGFRYYRGSMRIHINTDRRTFRIINTVLLEDYIASVVGGEMNFPEMEALKTQAVIARTYALWSLAHSSHNEYQLTDHTLNQVYKGILINRPDYLRAALSTSGEVLTWSGRLVLAAYSSTCGGQTSDNESIWSGNPLPYLRSVSDGDACSESPHFRWNYEVATNRIYQVLSRHTNRQISEIRVGNVDRHGLVTNIIARDNRGNEAEIRANTFRLLVNQQIEHNSIRSTRFQMNRIGNNYIFEGKGLGHGIGLCQWGARGLAQSGWNYRDILKLYYKGAEVVDIHSLEQPILHLAN